MMKKTTSATKAVSTPRTATKPKPSTPTSSKSQANTFANEVRIIAGQWKRSKLKVAQREGLRPTPARVRETLFNWLGHDLAGWRCLDAFAGSGALGFEAASRGASSVCMVEQDASLVTHLEQLKAQFHAASVQVLRGDGVATMARSAPASWDVIFLDPPFASNLYMPALQAAGRALAKNGFVYLEAPQAWQDAQLAAMGLRLHRHLKAGLVHAHLLTALDATPVAR